MGNSEIDLWHTGVTLRDTVRTEEERDESCRKGIVMCCVHEPSPDEECDYYTL